ncbi:hypothetical protein ACFFSW_23000 [Saccharothrix longispora]|uniref:ABC-type glycerol-3-phosphate transport system permease component n=1 Tax=Saccharothrix longispora TaxID=33920 RepID=A0ABU1PQU6_9PSEU|nr:hypothetical protein [Saccharothrix longispora]MDR6592961.1 ABC-type glycerol-3-phosphate transport system permease component [Saccharothrix longispora]
MAVLAALTVIWTWNEFFLPLVPLISNENQTVPVALGVLQGQRMMERPRPARRPCSAWSRPSRSS